MGITVEKLESIDNRIFGVDIRQHMGGVVRISRFAFLVRDIGGNDRRMIQRVTPFRTRAGQGLRITAVETHVGQRTDRSGTHIFT